MKKILSLGIALCLAIALAGCGGMPAKTDVTSPLPEGTSASAAASLPAPTEATTDDLPHTVQPMHCTEDQTLSYLDGEWELLREGNPLRMEPYAVLRFNKLYRTVSFTREADGEYVSAHFTLSDLFTEPAGTYDLMQWFPDDVSDGFVDKGDVTVIGTRTDFEIRFARNSNGTDILALREIGNGCTALAAEGFDYDLCGGEEDFWVFERITETDASSAPSDAEPIRGETFYAFRWFDFGDACDLQPLVKEREYTEDWYGEDKTVMQFAYTDRYTLSCARYTVQGQEDMAHSGAYNPGVVQVTTNADGVITHMEPVAYLQYGAYTV